MCLAIGTPRLPSLLPANPCPQTNRVNKILTIGEGGNLTQRNIWADDCLQVAWVGWHMVAQQAAGAWPGQQQNSVPSMNPSL